jgi:hypothetical protein
MNTEVLCVQREGGSYIYIYSYSLLRQLCKQHTQWQCWQCCICFAITSMTHCKLCNVPATTVLDGYAKGKAAENPILREHQGAYLSYNAWSLGRSYGTLTARLPKVKTRIRVFMLVRLEGKSCEFTSTDCCVGCPVPIDFS